MSRRARNQTTVSLFPFLAVLLCAMGALLVLLVITTRQIRDDALRHASARQLEVPEPAPAEDDSEPAYEWPDLAAVLGPAEELERKLLPAPPTAALIAPKPAFVKRETEPPPDLTADLEQLRQQIRQASSQLAGRRETAKDAQQRRAALLADIEKRENVLQNAEQAIAGFQSQRQQLSREEAALDQKAATMTRQLQQLQQETAEIARQPRNSQNVLKVVPYDGQQGTTRRPILIECANNTIRFVPEGIELTERDLVGFPLESNPLLAGVLAAEQYWIQRNQTEGKLGRPYVLVIVRPNGILAYYAARNLLQHYPRETGYELLTAGQKLALPAADPNAQQAIAQAVQRLLRQRGGTPAVAETLFPRVDPKYLERLRNGKETLGDESSIGTGSGSPLTTGNAHGKRFKFVQTSEGLRMVPIDGPAMKRFDTPGRLSEGGVAETRSAAEPNTNPSATAGNPSATDGSPFARNGNPDASNANPFAPDDNSAAPDENPATPKENPFATNENLSAPDGNSAASDANPVASASEPPPLPAPPKGMHIRNLALGQSEGSRPSESAAGSERSAPLPKHRQPAFTELPDNWAPLLDARRNQREKSAGTSGPQGNASSRSTNNSSTPGQGLTSPFDRGGIAFKRTIEIKISGTHLRVADRKTLRIPAGISTAQLLPALVSELRSEVQSWKEPPEQFYWKPAVRFVVYPGGSQLVEQLRPEFEKQGLLSGVTYAPSEPAADSDWRPTQR